MGIVAMLSFYFVNTLWDFFFDNVNSSMLYYVAKSVGFAIIFVIIMLIIKRKSITKNHEN
jgi:hypothetical protein